MTPSTIPYKKRRRLITRAVRKAVDEINKVTADDRFGLEGRILDIHRDLWARGIRSVPFSVFLNWAGDVVTQRSVIRGTEQRSQP